MSIEESQPQEPANRFRPGAVPGPPATPALMRPGALATPVQTGVAPHRPAGPGLARHRALAEYPEPEVLSTAVNPPSVFRPGPALEPSRREEARPGIRPAGATVIAPPWKERDSLTETGAEADSPKAAGAPRTILERANPREAGVRVRQVEQGPWPWSSAGRETAAVQEEPWAAAARESAREEAEGAQYRRPGREFPWRAWLLFALVWVGLGWLVLEREERIDQERSAAESPVAVENLEPPSHIGVDDPKEVRLAEP